jgi:hypothetical protein
MADMLKIQSGNFMMLSLSDDSRDVHTAGSKSKQLFVHYSIFIMDLDISSVSVLFCYNSLNDAMYTNMVYI